MIAAADPSSTLNKRAEIVSTCRHRAKFRYDRVSGAPTWWASRLGPMWGASGHISLPWWWTMVTPTQLCWRCHGLPLGQRYILYHPVRPSLVIHGHLTLTPQCTLLYARDTPENLCEEIQGTVSIDWGSRPFMFSRYAMDITSDYIP